MGNCLSFGAEGTHEPEILQSPSTKDEAKQRVVTINVLFIIISTGDGIFTFINVNDFEQY